MKKTQLVGFSFAVAGFAVLIAPAIHGEGSSAQAAQTVSGADNYYADCGEGQHNIFFQEEMPLKVYIKPGSGTSPWTDRHSQLVRRAFGEIASASNGKLSFVFVTHKPYDISCVFKPLNAQTRAMREGAITHKSTGPHHIEDATITFHSDDEKFNVFARFYQVALHEVGHAVGLGHSTHPEDVMYHQLEHGSAKTKYSARDIKTLSMLYAYKPPARELGMVSRHKLEKLSGGNLEKVKVKLSPQYSGSYSSKITNYLAKKLASNISIGSASLGCTYRFLVDRQGKMYNDRLVSSSGNDQFDRQVHNVLSTAEPLPKVNGLRMAELAEIKLKFNPDGTVTDTATGTTNLASSQGQSAMQAAPLKLATPASRNTSSQVKPATARTAKASPASNSQLTEIPFTDSKKSAANFKTIPESSNFVKPSGDTSGLSAINSILSGAGNSGAAAGKTSRPSPGDVAAKSDSHSPGPAKFSEVKPAVQNSTASGVKAKPPEGSDTRVASIETKAGSDIEATNPFEDEPKIENAGAKQSDKNIASSRTSKTAKDSSDINSAKAETVRTFKGKSNNAVSKRGGSKSSKFDAINAILSGKPVPKPKAPEIDVTPPSASVPEKQTKSIPQPEYEAPKAYSPTAKAMPPKIFDSKGAESTPRVAMSQQANSAPQSFRQPPESRRPAIQPRQRLTLEQWRRLVNKKATVNKHRLNLVNGARVEVSLIIDSNGYIQKMGIVESSGNRLTDSIAKLQCRSQQPYPIPPSGQSATHEVTVTFENTESE